MKIEGYLPTGIINDVTYYFSKSKKKFVDSVEKLYLTDLLLNKESAEKVVDFKDYPLIGKKGDVVKITLKIDI